MKIALIATEKLPVPAVRGGAIQIYIEGIAPRLAEEHEVTVFSVRDRRLKKKQQVNGIRYIRVPGKENKAQYLRCLRKALRRRGRFDVIQVFNRPDFIGPLRRASPRSRVVLSLHNEMFAKCKLTRKTAVTAVRNSSAIVTVSRYIARTVRRRVPRARKRLRTIYSGVDTERFRPAYEMPADEKQLLKQKLGLANRRVILGVGRLSPTKGFHVLLKSMRRVLRQHKDAALLIIGSSWFGTNAATPYTRKIRRMSKRLGKRVVFTGFVKPSNLPKYYGIADMFVCASQWREPLARVHYEAMAAGLPIVTTQRGGNPEVVRNTGCGLILKRYNKPKAMGRLICRVLNDSQAAEEMGRKGRQMAEERYNWDRVCRDLLRIYKRSRKRRLPSAQGLSTNLPASPFALRRSALRRGYNPRFRVRKLASVRSRVKRRAINAT